MASVFSEAQVAWESDRDYADRLRGQITSLKKTIAYWDSRLGLGYRDESYICSERDRIAAKIADKQAWIDQHG